MKIKKKILKVLCVLFIIFLLINIMNTVTQATTIINDIDESVDQNNILDEIWNTISPVIDGVIGVLTIVIRIPLLLIVIAIQFIMTGIADLGGSNIEGILTPEDIFFNRIGLTNINFFDFLDNSSVIQTIRINVATWYYVLRIISILVLMVVLIYIGIRMAISTIASERAQYKRMLMDWAVSFALVFLLNYIIMFTLEANNALVGLLEAPVRVKLGPGIIKKLIKDSAVSVAATVSWGSLIVYAMLVGMTTAFLFSYIRRMLTIGFLIIISPLITITYSIDKVKDGRAQALNTWLREFMFTVLIQPFHCIIYLVFVSSAMALLSMGSSLPRMVLSIACMWFVWQAEKIVKEIFGFKAASTSLGDTVASMKAVETIGKAVGKVGGTGKKAISQTTFGKNISNKVNSSAVGRVSKKIGESKYGEFVKSVGVPLGAGAVAAGFEVGLNSSAHAAHVGAETYSAVRALMTSESKATGTKNGQGVQNSENDLKKYSELISNNNNFNFANFQTDATTKNNLRSYAQSLIGANMDMLNDDIQKELRNLRLSNPKEYDPYTATGMTNLKNLQDMALDLNLDFNNPSTNPLGHAWTKEEKAVVTAIQTRNLAQAVNTVHTQYSNSGSTTPKVDIDNFINSL